MNSQSTQTIKPIENALKEIGYRDKLIQRNYQFTDFISRTPESKTIDLGVFGREPLDYRSACLGFYFSTTDGSERMVDEARAFGSPQVFIVREKDTERWSVGDKRKEFKETFSTKNIGKVITENRLVWGPENVIRAKSGFINPGPRQLDFVDIGFLPALEREASAKINDLIKRILHQVENELKRLKLPFESKEVFRVVFCFLAAKLLRDREVSTSPSIDFSLPLSSLLAVSNYYGDQAKNINETISTYIHLVADEIGRSFSFRNLSVDSLTYIYENTFVTEEKRREFGIHSTPSYIADYVLAKMPIEGIPREKWKVLDPMCGHGIFLIAAMRRMRDLLPENWSGQHRHQFFARALHGIEIESFSVEVAKLCLRLADFPERNGWQLTNDDVFRGNILEKSAADTTILVGNPPFEKIENKRPDTPKPVELLNRVLPNLPQGALIGMVFPNSFLDGSDYRKQRKQFLGCFEILSLTSLPDRIFPYSDAETAIIVARKQKPANEIKTYYCEVRESQREAFQSRYEVTWEDYVPQSYFEKQDHLFIVPLLRELWDTIKSNPTLAEIAEIKIGAQYEPEQVKNKIREFVRSKPFSGGVLGIFNVTANFVQFAVGEPVYMATDKHLRRKRALGAWDIDWKKEKVLVPTSRLSRGPWRTAGAIDKKGHIVNRNFYAIWPKTAGLSVETLAALINSPLASAYLYGYCGKRDIPKRYYAAIPIPKALPVHSQQIELLVKQYLNASLSNESKARKALLEIDAEVLKAYKLPPRLERKLLDLFWATERRVPFEFTGYIPPEEESWLPLHMYISEKFEESTHSRILKRMPVIKDKKLLRFLKRVGTETDR